ncbi:MAG: GumC family protein [Mangrovibacterium sp.]
MDQNEELLKLLVQNEGESFNPKEFLYKLLHYWKWFVVAAVIGVGAAYVFNRYAPPSYAVNSRLLVKEKKSDGMNLDKLFDNFSLKSDVKLENHIGILSSFSLNHEVIENLGWRVSWFRDMPFGDYDLFGREPFEVIIEPEALNLKKVALHVSMIDSSRYRVEADQKVTIDGQTFEVSFDEEGIFGEKFENDYFNFVLNKYGEAGDGDFYFVFNDYDDLTLNYMKRVNIAGVNKNADLISLDLTGDNPQREITYLNELADVYIRYGLKEKNLISENTIRFIDQQMLAIVDTLKITSDHLTNYRADNKVFDLSQKASLVVEKLVELDSKRSLAEMQLEYYENLKNYMDNAERMKHMVYPSVVGITDAGLNSLVVRLSELYSKKEALSYSLQEKNPGYQLVDRELEFTRRSLNENLNNLVFNAKKELDAVKQEIAVTNEQLGDYPKTEQDLINIKRMFDLNNELYTFLLQKRAEAQITKASNIADVDVLDPARKATIVRKGPRSALNMMIGLILGLALPFIIIVGRDYFDETIKGRDELEKLSSLPILADVMHNVFDDEIPVVKHPRSVLAESIRELRTNLEYMSFDCESCVIGVHSMVPGEGKTFISANLASMIAMNNKKAVLIGGDMRKPTLHRYFGIPSNEGLSTYLIGNHTLDQIIQRTEVSNLDFIAAGTIPPNPAELLSSKEFGKLIAELKKRYDLVIIDNSPMTLVTDGSVVSRHTDINLFVVRQRYSHRQMIELMNQLVEKKQMKKAGIVVNDVDPKKYGNYAYRYGGYYRKAYHSNGVYFEDEALMKN